MKILAILPAAALALAAGSALADDHPAEQVRTEATERGTLHPGHVAVFASGKYNKPAEEYHLVDTPPGYEDGPGGWAETRKGKKDD